MENQIPHNLEAECVILGTVMVYPDKINYIINRLTVNDFFDERNKIIYQNILFLYNKNEDYTAPYILNRLNQNRDIDKIGGEKTIKDMVVLSHLAFNIEEYINIVIDLSIKRQVMETAILIRDKGFDSDLNVNEYLDLSEELIFKLAKKRKSGSFLKFSDVTDSFKSKVEYNMKNKGTLTGLDTGFSNLNNFTSGFHPEELIIIAARPSVGKSAFAINLAYNIAERNNGNVAVFSLEMSNEQIVSRIYSNLTNIDLTTLNTGNLTKEEWRKFELTSQDQSKVKILFDDSSGISIGELRSKCRKIAQQEGIKAIIIDYLQLVTVDGLKNNNRQEEVAYISRSLKQMARELKVPVIALSQLSREVDKSKDKKPMMSHLRESGSIEQDADIVMFLHRDDYYENEKKDIAETELIIAKNRQGKTGTIYFYFELKYSRFRAKLDEQK